MITKAIEDACTIVRASLLGNVMFASTTIKGLHLPPVLNVYDV